MVLKRIADVLTFRRQVYAEVEDDTGFTTTAWLLVMVVSFVSQVGSQVSGNHGNWLARSAGGTILMVVGFGVAATVMSWVGRAFFGSRVKFRGLVRALGLAYVWNIVGVVGILGVNPGLGWLAAPARVVGATLGLGSWMLAAKEALGLRWDQTVLTVGLGWGFLLLMMVGMALMSLGVGVVLLGGLFGF
jgi:hypothetical protein